MSQRKCDVDQWCDRACTHACERAVQAKAEASIANATDLLAGLPHYVRHKWGMAESTTGEYVKASDVRAALETEQTMHAAWRKRAEEAEADLAAAQALQAEMQTKAHLADEFLTEIERNLPDYAPADSPAEVICDLINERDEARTDLAAAQARIQALEKDAARYRQIRRGDLFKGPRAIHFTFDEPELGHHVGWHHTEGDELDRMTDAAIVRARGGADRPSAGPHRSAGEK